MQKACRRQPFCIHSYKKNPECSAVFGIVSPDFVTFYGPHTPPTVRPAAGTEY